MFLVSDFQHGIRVSYGQLNFFFLVEPKFTIKSFHQCSNLISIKLDSANYLLWRCQVQPLIHSLGINHHTTNFGKPKLELSIEDESKIQNPNYIVWVHIDGLLVVWLLGTMTADVLFLTFGLEIASQVWKAIDKHLLPTTEEKEKFVNKNLMTLKNGNLHID